MSVAGAEAIQKINIPESVTYDGISYTVVSIGENAFNNNSEAISITIPNTVTSIGAYAFHNCGVFSLEIPNSVTSLGEFAFSYSSIEHIKLSESLTQIPASAFRNCISLQEIIIPDAVKIIRKHAFEKCTRATKVTLSKNLEEIEYDAFRNLAIDASTVATINSAPAQSCHT